MSNLLTINGGGQSLLLRRRALLMNQGFEVEWNQLVPFDKIPNTVTINGITFTKNEDSVTINGISTDAIWGAWAVYPFQHPYFPTGRTVGIAYYKCSPEGGSLTTYYGRYKASFNEYGDGIIMEKTFWNWNSWFGVAVSRAGIVINNKTIRPHIFDLTQMFGSGNEPATVEQFEAWLTENNINPNEYIPYNAGEKRKMTKPSWLL